MTKPSYSGRWGYGLDGRWCFKRGQRGNGTRYWSDGSMRSWHGFGHMVAWKDVSANVARLSVKRCGLDILVDAASKYQRAKYYASGRRRSELDVREMSLIERARIERRLKWKEDGCSQLKERIQQTWACRACGRVTPRKSTSIPLAHFVHCKNADWRHSHHMSRIFGWPMSSTQGVKAEIWKCEICGRRHGPERINRMLKAKEKFGEVPSWAHWPSCAMAQQGREVA